MARKLRPIRIEWMKSGVAHGYAHDTQRRIQLDMPLDHKRRQKKLLEIALHEAAHVELPALAEEAVDSLARHQADVLWRLGFRRIEDGNL